MMSEPSPSPDRRAFLRQTLAAAAAGPLAIAADSRARGAGPSAQEEADAFLASYVEGWLPLETDANGAAWVASTDVTEAHTAEQVEKNQALSEFVGAPRVIEAVRRLLSRKAELDELTVRQLEKVRLRAAEAPGTAPEVVKARNLAEAAQSAAQDSFAFTLERPGEPETHPTANDLDRVLVESRDLAARRDVWEVSKTVGGPLREGLLRLRDLRNRVAKELGFDSFFALQVADYGLTVPEMVALTDGFLAEVRPLYEQLHTWAKHTLAARYGAEAPDGPIPAHWLPNRWGQNWPGLVEGVDLDPPLLAKSREFVVEQAEQFYVSLGFPKLPRTFYTRSDLYPADPASGRKKNSHASAWHVDLRDDVRSLMSVEPDSRWFTTAHHELGHIYYYISYSTPRVPFLLRGGANRAFHEAIGDLIGLAAGSRAYLDSIGLLPDEAKKAEPVTWLLDTALDASSVVFLPFAAGVMTYFERDFYAGEVEADALNRSWWDLVRRHQGIVPPGPRPETLCDPATKTHINDDPGQYYDYAIGTVIKFQLHDHIAREILGQDPRDCNYFGNRKVGDFLREILSSGATRDWNTVLRQATGSSLTARPLVAYFEPLARWLEEQNRGRKVGWG
jgi:peptidyl-dipeptidase A